MMDADFILPCDVHLPPTTVLRKGVPMSTLLTAMRQREGMDEGMTCFNRDAKRSDLDALARAAQDHGGEANEMIGEVERRRAATMGLVDGYAGIIRGLETKLSAAEARAAKAVEVLRRVEEETDTCPCCGRWLKVDGKSFQDHARGCIIEEFLSDNPAPDPGVEAGEVGAAFCWAMDEIDRLSNRLCGFAYPQGMAMLGREDQNEAYVAAVYACRRSIQTPADGGRS
jgi:hypothetical protein